MDNRLEGSKILAITDGKAPSQPISFIDDYQQKEEGFKLKYYMWLSRFFIFLSIVSLMVFLSASLALFRLAPQVEVKPFLIIPQDNSDGIVRTESIDLGMASKDQLMKMYIKQYVIVRNTIIFDHMEMQTRWLPGGMVNFYSIPKIFNTFYQNVEKTWNKIFELETVQEVEIISVDRVGGSRSPVWKVDFKTYTLTRNKNADNLTRAMEVKYWTASVTAFFVKGRRFVGRRLMNPLGFTVSRYSQTQVEGL